MIKHIVGVFAVLLLTACVHSNQAGSTPVYKDISGQSRPEGQFVMAQAHCRNVVNSHVTPYEGPSGNYSTSRTGTALNNAMGSVSRAMSGPTFSDCMLAQGFQIVGYE